MSNFDQIYKSLKNLGQLLVPYNYPLAPSDQESIISPLKSIELEVDGYTVVISYNKGDYEDHYLETFQVYGRYTPFLPFHLVVKLAKKVLGNDNLALLEIWCGNTSQRARKIYCWTLTVGKDGQPKASPYKNKMERHVFEGFAYNYVEVGTIDLY